MLKEAGMTYADVNGNNQLHLGSRPRLKHEDVSLFIDYGYTK